MLHFKVQRDTLDYFNISRLNVFINYFETFSMEL